jgi:hypothetical protein
MHARLVTLLIVKKSVADWVMTLNVKKLTVAKVKQESIVGRPF